MSPGPFRALVHDIREEPPLNPVREDAQPGLGGLGEVIGELLVVARHLLSDFLGFHKKDRPNVLEKRSVDRFDRSARAEIDPVFRDAFPRIGQIVSQKRKQWSDQALLGHLLVPSNVLRQILNALDVLLKSFSHGPNSTLSPARESVRSRYHSPTVARSMLEENHQNVTGMTIPNDC